MSKMLEQAIVDAEALKEAALKNAEQAIIEKYSNEIKKAMESLLEQPEEPLGDLGMSPEAPMTTDEFPDVPPAGMEGEDLCPCPDEEEEVEIDFDALASQMAAEEGAEMVARDEFADDELELTEEQDSEEELKEDEDDVELTEEDIAKILEELSVDIKGVPSGQAGGASNITLEKELQDIVLAQEAEEEAVEENEDKKEIKEALESFTKEKEALVTQNEKLLEQNKKFTDLLMQLKEKLEETNLSNAKLFYTNKTLSSASLNERQKKKIVEAISKVKSVEEAKTLYETLQSAVGPSRKVGPKSLSEVVRRPSTTLPRRNEVKKSDPVSNRWKTLAGIK